MNHTGENPLRPVSVLSIGTVTPLGRNLGEIARRLDEPAAAGGVLAVADELLAEPSISKRLRRADRLVRMAVIAAMDAWAGGAAACAGIPQERVGLIVTSGLGPHCRGFRFLDGLLDCGDAAALPTDFSHSVHGAPAAYISEILGLRGPSLTATDFECGFEQAVLQAQCWLTERVCERVLVGAVEEVGPVMMECASRLLGGDARFKPGEGSVFVMLGAAENGEGLSGVARLDAGATSPREVDLLIVEEPRLPMYQQGTQNVQAKRTVSFTPWFGHSASSAAFQLLGGLLSMQKSRGGVDSVAILMPSSNARATPLLLTSSNR